MISVLAGLVTLPTSVVISPGQQPRGSSTTAIMWIHCAAALGRKLWG